MLQLQFFENLTSVSCKKKKRDIHLSNAKIPDGPGDREILNFYLGNKIKVYNVIFCPRLSNVNALNPVFKVAF